MLRDPPSDSAGEARSAPDRIFEGRRNQAPPVVRSAVPCERCECPRHIGPTSLVAQPHLGDEPVIASHLIDVKAASTRRGADDPLARPAGFDDDTLVIEERLRGSEHA
jgi:hypothetical protein